MSTQQGSSPEDHRFVFVGGMHRSGTSLLADIIARHPAASGLTGTGAFMDEGQHIQRVYPTGRRYGGPGSYALHDAMHATETDPLITAANRDRLWSSWSPYWDLSKQVLVEKSPPNMLRSRFLQALFPGASFVMIVRHPVAAVAATRKMTRTPAHRMFRNWAAGHATMLGDLPHLQRVLFLRYEDLVTDIPQAFTQLSEFLGLPPAQHAELPEARPRVNDRYVSNWWFRPVRGGLLGDSTVAPAVPLATSFGYDVHEPLPVGPMTARP